MKIERVLEIAPLVEDSDALKAEARLQNALASRLISDEEVGSIKLVSDIKKSKICVSLTTGTCLIHRRERENKKPCGSAVALKGGPTIQIRRKFLHSSHY